MTIGQPHSDDGYLDGSRLDGNPVTHPLTRSKPATALLYTVVFNTAIAVLLTVVGFGRGFGATLLFSQCVGLSICGCIMVAMHTVNTASTVGRAVTFCAALTVGSAAGTVLGAHAVRLTTGGFQMSSIFFVQVLGIGIMFGLIITYFFYSRERLSASAQAIQDERIKRLSSEKQALEADLKRLQAQIEPHFLFNTLSNILSLMDSDPATARSMQINLICYLRITLARTRNATTTLGQEAELIRAFLDIYKIRMGDRMHYALDFPDALKDYPFAPMLIQPLVENAVIHGLEPKVEGGSIRVRAYTDGAILKLEIADTGEGLPEKQKPGVTLANVKARLAHLFGGDGRLILKANQPTGLCVTIEVPLSPTQRPYHDIG